MSGPEAIWSEIEQLQGGKPWGNILDAGTGMQSLDWVRGLSSTSWTAVTANVNTRDVLLSSVKQSMRRRDRILLGRWEDADFLSGERYEIVLCHYLLGGLERVSAYFEDKLLARLKLLCAGRLFLVGLEPLLEPSTAEERLVVELLRLRDACLLLSGSRAYREYPLDWVVSRVAAAGGRLREKCVFPNYYSSTFIQEVIEFCQKRCSLISDRELAEQLISSGRRLLDRALGLCLKNGALRCGNDYLLMVEFEVNG